MRVDDVRGDLNDLLSRYGQEHVLQFWDALNADERRELGRQIRALDLDLIARLTAPGTDVEATTGALEPAPFKRLPHDAASREQWRRAADSGRDALAAGRVAAMVVAGGQGTRLGFDGPKGAFPIGPVTGRTLFQIHVEKVLAASKRYGRQIPFLVMTSPSNDADTKAFFQDNADFGLPEGSLHFFAQGEMPAVGDRGRLMLQSPGCIFMSPNGHGGALKALWDSGMIEWLENRGVDFISYFQIDNPLVKVIDPAFVGFHVLCEAEMSLKLLYRTIPDEKLGIWVRAGGREQVIEYSDMPPQEMRARDADGALKYSGGSIAIHCFSTGFVRRLSADGFLLPYHRARKKVPFVTSSGTVQEPGEPNATKFEMFIFDALHFADSTCAVETSREEEFSPVKNAAGPDSPHTARRDLSRLYARWLEAAGVEVSLDSGGYPVHALEISPLVADDADALSGNYRGPFRLDGPLAL